MVHPKNSMCARVSRDGLESTTRAQGETSHLKQNKAWNLSVEGEQDGE